MNIVNFDESFLELSYDWLQNDKELKWLTVTGDFTIEDQQNWFNSIHLKSDYKIFGITIDNQAAGAFGIKNIENGTGEYWGYIGLREYWGKGKGKILMKLAFEKAREFGLKSLYLFVRNLENKRAINLYLSEGFEVVENGPGYVKMIKQLQLSITKEAENNKNFTNPIFFATSARTTFSHILKHIFEGSDKKILMPSYIGETEKEGSGVFDPVRENKIEFDFYKIQSDLSGNLNDISAKIASGEFGALLIVHYFGFVQNEMDLIKELCRNNKVILIEDCCHSFFTKYNGTNIGLFGDFSFYSIHKIIPTADGGFYRANNSQINIPNEIDSNKKIALPTIEHYIRSDYESINLKRIENYNSYLNKWQSNNLVHPLYQKLPEGAVPLNFPIIFKKGLREKCYFELIERGVLTCSLYYRMIREIDKVIYPVSYEISGSILNLPVHQDTGLSEIDFILEQLFDIIQGINED